MAHRLEITLQDELLAALDAARGHEPRASFVKRTLSEAVDGQRVVAVAELRGGEVPAVLRMASATVGDTVTVVRDAIPLAGDQLRNGAPVLPAHQCPVVGCTFSAASPAAVCARHGRKVKP